MLVIPPTPAERFPPGIVFARSPDARLGYNVSVENPFTGLRAALFDLDGTLIETHIDFGLMKRQMLHLAESAGLDPAHLRDLDILAIVEKSRDELEHRSGPETAARFRSKAFALLEEIEVSHCANPVEIPGAAELLQTLESRDIPVAIVTRNCRTVSERLVNRAGLTHSALLTRDDVPLTKPDPAHLRAALVALGLNPTPKTRHPAPSDAMVGDHWMDVQGGQAAGMRTVGILRGRQPSFFDPAPPDLHVHELADLLPLAKTA
jgi:phosphoglycolate phosphatase-like HAD superfamily hydrolase